MFLEKLNNSYYEVVLIKLIILIHFQYTNKELKDVIQKNIALARFRSAWAVCQVK